MKAYRIHIVDNQIFGKLERYINEDKTVKEPETIKINRNYLHDGMLYCPEVDMIVDETEKIKINKKINNLTEKKTEIGTAFRHLSDMTKEERLLYHKLENERYSFYKNEMKFVEYGDEEEYFKNLSNIYKDA